MARLTKKVVDAAKPDPKTDLWIWDDDMPGFGLRVFPSGVKSYLVQYRNTEGRTRRLTIGRHGRLTPEEARRIAQQHLAAVGRYEDPVEKKAAMRSELTFGEFAKRYLADHAELKKKPKSVAEDKKILDTTLLPAFRSRKIGAITRQDVARLHSSMSKSPIFANRTVALLSKMLNLAEAWGYRPEGSNPCRHIGKYPENHRRRYLSGEELARLGAALNAAETSDKASERITPTQALLFRLLLFTGCRLNEILTLKWEEVDFERGLLLLPDSKTGQKTIVLSGPAAKLLTEATRGKDNPYVIHAARKNAQGEHVHTTNPHKAWGKVRTRAGLQDLRLHDLRHTFASVGAGRNLGLPMIGALLGHTQAATTQRYAHLAADPLRQAADLIAGELLAAMEKKPEAEVVDLDSARRHK